MSHFVLFPKQQAFVLGDSVRRQTAESDSYVRSHHGGRWRISVIGAVCGLLSTFTNEEIMEKVNANLPKDEQFGPLGWYQAKNSRLQREYKRLYPSGQLLQKQRLLFGIMVFCILIAGLSLSFGE